MEATERRKRRLAQILHLAQAYRGWTRKELARNLRRDPTKLIPGSGVPKLDLVVDLAQVLDWSVEDVVAFFWTDEGRGEGDEPDPLDFDAMDEAMRDAHRAGRYQLLVELAQRAAALARTPEERARACNREAGGWDGMGRYRNARRALRRGLVQAPISGTLRRMLQSNLANAHYTLWSLVEARAIAGELVAWYDAHGAETPRDRRTHAFALYVSGHARRRMLGEDPDDAAAIAAAARVDLARAQDAYLALAREEEDESFAGIAHTCAGGLIEVEAALGERSGPDALAAFVSGLEALELDPDVGPAPVGDRLESWGWWCIFGCNVALRTARSEAELQRHMAIFTGTADEIAERLDSWAIRERVFTMEHVRWTRAVGCTGLEIPHVLDRDDARVVTGTMGRFPTFRETGWRILREVEVVAGR